MTRLVTWFLRGLVFLVPIAITVWLLVTAFVTIDGWLGLPVPGVGLLIVITLTTAFGFLLSNFLTRSILGVFERFLDRLPFVRLLHTSMKDLMTAFVGEKKRSGRAVAVELIPGSGVRVLGFVTREDLSELGLGEQIAVYFPQSYNFAGQVVLVPRERVLPLEVESHAVMTFIVSGGVTGGGAPGSGAAFTALKG
jgi:uncharacterized membrane protein